MSTKDLGAPYVLDERLYVGGEPVSGRWTAVTIASPVWVATYFGEESNRLAWGTDATVHELPAGTLSAAASPDGSRLLWTEGVNELDGVVHVLDLASGKELPHTFELVLAREGDRSVALSPSAFTADGRVYLSGHEGNVLWDPVTGKRTDIAAPNPGYALLELTGDGKHWYAGHGDGYVIGTLDAQGRLVDPVPVKRRESVPSPHATWVAAQAGELEHFAYTELYTSLHVEHPDGSDPFDLAAPDGWGVEGWQWSPDESRILLQLFRSDEDRSAGVCDVRAKTCRLVGA